MFYSGVSPLTSMHEKYKSEVLYGKKDGITNKYVRENEIFADVFNFYIYNGKQVIDPEQLQSLDTAEIGTPFGGKEGQEVVQKYRDILKRVAVKQDDNMTYLLLGIEDQTRIHYAMPVRNIIYDALQYGKQVYLSAFYKEDRIVPVVTLVIFFGAKKWDGPLSLNEMMGEQPSEIMELVQDYRIHLIQPATLTDEDLEKFQTSMREVMSFIKYSKDKSKIRSLLKDNPRFRGLRREAAMVIDEYTNMEYVFDEEESVNMCEGVQGMIDDAVEEALEKENTALVENIKNLMKNMNWTVQQAVEAMGLSEEKKQIVLKKLE